MDELDVLKRDWKEKTFTQVSENDIYKMLHKKSSSIVKWILIISILEIIFWSLVNIFSSDESYLQTLERYHIKTMMNIVNVLNYFVILFFIYLFYKNYKTINTTQSVKMLMQNIINTRKTVNYYIWYNLLLMLVVFIIAFTFQFIYDEKITNLINKLSENTNTTFVYLLFFVFYALLIAIFIGGLWLFYKLLYGILLKKLNKNYKELEKMEL